VIRTSGLRAVSNFIDYNRGVPVPQILQSRQLSRAQFYRDLKIAKKLLNFDPEAVKNRALFNISAHQETRGGKASAPIQLSFFNTLLPIAVTVAVALVGGYSLGRRKVAGPARIFNSLDRLSLNFIYSLDVLWLGGR
jgi:hypothetical protein